MIVGLIGFIAAFATLCILRIVYFSVYRFRNRTENDVTPFLVKINLGELNYLVDSLTEEQLLYELGPEEFRKEQLIRLRLLQEYTRWMRHNADILEEWGEYGFRRRRYAEEDGIKSCSLELIKSCREFRYGARRAVATSPVVFPYEVLPLASCAQAFPGAPDR